MRINRRKQPRRGQGLTSDETLELLLAWPQMSGAEAEAVLESHWIASVPGYAERLRAEREAWLKHGGRFQNYKNFSEWYEKKGKNHDSTI